ncbi:unnamed protein product [marine sediment metagenome]|uniref:Uncharacterized protein n=1 Tax=marine sediment metagenome TaxID=412755 RepID=X0WEL0_9ZZZZ
MAHPEMISDKHEIINKARNRPGTAMLILVVAFDENIPILSLCYVLKGENEKIWCFNFIGAAEITGVKYMFILG